MTKHRVCLGPDETELLGQLANAHPRAMSTVLLAENIAGSERAAKIALSNLAAIGCAAHDAGGWRATADGLELLARQRTQRVSYAPTGRSRWHDRDITAAAAAHALAVKDHPNGPDLSTYGIAHCAAALALVLTAPDHPNHDQAIEQHLPAAGEENGVSYDVYCEECGARAEHRLGAWICPTHGDRERVRFEPRPRDYRDVSAAARYLDVFHSHPNSIGHGGTNGLALRRALHEEEHQELMAELEAECPDRAKIARELADVLYVSYGTAWAYGIDLDAALAEVHRAAMDKMRAGLRRADGKILKPPGFRPPDLTGALLAPRDEAAA